MASVRPSQFENVKAIAAACKSVDPEWCKAVEGAQNEEEVVRQCSPHLDRLAGTIYKCSSLFFNCVRFRQEMEVNGSLRGRVDLNSLWLVAGNDMREKPWNIDAIKFRLPREKTDFYILHNREVYHIQLSPDLSSCAMFSEPKDGAVWDTSTTQMEEMVKQSWHNCFVTAMSSWNKVIPIPK